ncbi:PDDEXK-like family protein [Paucilactobacillus sp. N302-9]
MKLKEEAALNGLVTGLENEINSQLKNWLIGNNIFNILGLQRNEIRHSNFIAWLVNPSANRVFGDYFLKKILLTVIKNGSVNDLSELNVMLNDYSDATVLREYHNIDILIKSANQRTKIVIENKIDSQQHDQQLQRYQKFVQKNSNKDDKLIFIYLTIDGDDPKAEGWQRLSYTDVLEILQNMMNRAYDESIELQYVRDYINLLKVNIVRDEELTKTVEKIYAKYHDAIDLIIENLPNASNQINEDVTTAIKELENKIGIDPFSEDDGGKTLMRFKTPKMDKVFKNWQPVKGATGWHSGSPYFWELKIPVAGRAQMQLAFHAENQTVETIKEINEFLVAHNTKELSATSKWRLLREKWSFNFEEARTPKDIVNLDKYSEKFVQKEIERLLKIAVQFE